MGKQPQITLSNFIAKLHDAVPEADSVVAEHLADNDELLIHLLMFDLLRFCTAKWADSEAQVVARTLAFVDSSLAHGDGYVENAVAASFVEHVGAWPGETPEFIASWPPGLLAERRRQLDWYRNHNRS